MSTTTQKTETNDEVDQAVNEVMKKWWQLEDEVSSVRWKQGELIHDNIEGLSKPQKSSFYNKMVRETGKKREVLANYVWFYKVFPDLPDRIKKSGIRASKWIVIAEHGKGEIPVDLSLEDIRDMSVRNLRNWFGDKDQVPIECDVCGETMNFGQQGLEWERIVTCNDCKEKITRMEGTVEEVIRMMIQKYDACPKCGGELKDALDNMWKCKKCGEIVDPSLMRERLLNERE